MDSIAFDNATRALYSLAHSIAENGMEQNRIVREMQDSEHNCIALGYNNDRIITELTRLLLNEMEIRRREGE